MTMDEKEIEKVYLNALEMALQKEEYSYEFYTKSENVIKFKPLKEFFRELAEEEVKHKNLILNQMDKMSSGKAVMGKRPLSEPVKDLGIGKYLKKQEVTKDMTYQDALILAMKREEEAVNLFDNLINISENQELKDFFIKLKNWEVIHLKRLEEKYDEDILTWN